MLKLHQPSVNYFKNHYFAACILPLSRASACFSSMPDEYQKIFIFQSNSSELATDIWSTQQPKHRAVRETVVKLIYGALQADIIAMKLLPRTVLNKKALLQSLVKVNDLPYGRSISKTFKTLVNIIQFNPVCQQLFNWQPAFSVKVEKNWYIPSGNT